MRLRRCRSRGEGTDLDEVVGQDAVPGPDSGAFGAVDAGAIPAVATLEGADAAFTSGAPLDCSSERASVFLGLPGLAGFDFAGYHDRAHAEVVQGVVDAFLAVAAVGGDGARRAPGSLLDPRDRRDDDDYFEVIGDDDGVFGCMSLLACHDVCPKNLPLATQIAFLRRKMVSVGWK